MHNKMSKKEEFLGIKTAEEYERRKHEFEGMSLDKEILIHLMRLKNLSFTREELYSEKRERK